MDLSGMSDEQLKAAQQRLSEELQKRMTERTQNAIEAIEKALSDFSDEQQRDILDQVLVKLGLKERYTVVIRPHDTSIFSLAAERLETIAKLLEQTNPSLNVKNQISGARETIQKLQHVQQYIREQTSS